MTLYRMGHFFYYLTSKYYLKSGRITFLKSFFFHKEIMGWTSVFSGNNGNIESALI